MRQWQEYHIVLSSPGYDFTSGGHIVSQKRKSTGTKKPVREQFGKDDFPPVSIVVPTAHENEILFQTMRHIGNLKYPRQKLEVILVNNGEGPPGEDYSALLPWPLKCVVEERRGRARARNRGIRQAEGEWILFLDDDVLAEESLLMEHMLFHLEHPRSLVLGEVLPCPGTSVLDAMHLAESFRGQAHGELLEYGAITCNLSLRRSDVLDVGLFDESFDLYGFEDLDLGYRLIKEIGLKLRYNKRARGWHYRLLGKDKALVNYFQAGISFTRFLRKHPAALLDRSSPRIAGHLRYSLLKAITFRPLDVFERDEKLRLLGAAEECYREDPGDEQERLLSEHYRGLLDYTFIEGAFLGLKGLAGKKAPLLADPDRELADSHRRLSIYSLGHFGRHSGLGNFARATSACANQLGYDVDEADMETLPDFPPESDLNQHHIILHHHRNASPVSPAGPYKIHVTTCETSLIPQELTDSYNRMDEIWVPSTFCRVALLNSGITRPVTVIPYGIDPRRLRTGKRSHNFFPPDHLCFMALGELRDSKGFDLLIRAYYEEFSRRDPVILILKLKFDTRITGIARWERMERFIEPIRKATGKKSFPPLFLYYEDIPACDYADFLDSCDAYICASRGEGFCMPILESMFLGKTIISTAYGGQMDYLTEENSYLIDYEPCAADSSRQGTWALPSIEHLGGLMRRVSEKRDEARRKASQGKHDALRRWSLSCMRGKMSQRIDEIYRGWGWRSDRIFRCRKTLV
jgi:glycosyltransferase involved in cell wall biosynthesis